MLYRDLPGYTSIFLSLLVLKDIHQRFIKFNALEFNIVIYIASLKVQPNQSSKHYSFVACAHYTWGSIKKFARILL